MDSWSSDPGSGAGEPLSDALRWLQDTALGTVATTIAVIAIAAIGFLLLTGRIDWRRGVSTIVGCFILFGAPTIAAGLLSALNNVEGSATEANAISPPPALAIPPIQAPTPPPTHEPIL